ncbi:MAG TPA: cytochrome c oxidase subunit 3 [Sphingomonas sp.]|jgi:heme/copper-type cytochrome/quinol oxidase subunit 3|uniref:cytochrome c oxidase subunit 3 n=1 Tax=Sphingomonas sp. TaxID=28214 RepID=UPI002ED7832C
MMIRDPRPIRITGDLSHLPDSASGARHLVWWGNIGFMLIEGTGFAMAAAAYLYLMTQASQWPPAGTHPPDLMWGMIFTAGLMLSEGPNLWVRRRAVAKDARGVRIGVAAMTVIGLLLLIPRAYEFAHLGTRWYDNAYGSVVWMLMVLHTMHVVTDWGDTAVQAAWLFTHEVGDDQFADVENNANYWTFVVGSWLPIGAIVYGLARLS